ncbi:MAG TPA: serine/threonine-protein kinase, partial [Polyangiales bacterium]|nr:serine/threonine-protein kinase [Polyangiales bacterium]
MANEQAAATREAPGRSLDGRYRLDGEIGAGALGVVYRATHEKLAKPFAVKLLHAHCGENAVMRGRFEREAKMLASLDHPNIVAVTDFGIAEDAPYLVMELLEGETLADRLARGPLDQQHAAQLSEALLRALAFVHARGLVHRDVKPGNVFLQKLPDGSERLKVLDFGLAKLTAAVNDNEDPTLTRAGSIVGTPAYMSPEQASGEEADARSDVYAAGVIVIQMLAGRLPFLGDAIDQLRSHLVAPVPTLAELSANRVGTPAFDAFVARAMAKRREERFANAAEMLTALEAMPQPWFSESDAAISSALGIASTLVAEEPITVAAISGTRERTSAPSPPELRSVSQLMAAESRRAKLFVASALGAVAIAVVAAGYAVRHPELAVPAALEQHPKSPPPSAAAETRAPNKPLETP